MTSEAIQEWISAYRVKIELHAHTRPASECGKQTPHHLMALLHKEGFDTVVLTNHFHVHGPFAKKPDPVGAYLEDYYACEEEAKRYGMTVILGADYRFADNNNDYVVYGLDEAFLRETYPRLGMTYRQFYETYHSPDLLILQAHPFRDGCRCEETDHMDGLEVFNCHPGHNSRMAVAARVARQRNLDLITVSSDQHEWGQEGICSLRAKTNPQNGAELVSLLRSKDYLFEIGGIPVLPYARFED
ncbi:MAG: PHP domain-containing protein [Candidatus Methanomethylophilaceae archaeon]|nr:PHP domain-containing protein [Candidatus Methanomethylophilaceae archaeon]